MPKTSKTKYQLRHVSSLSKVHLLIFVAIFAIIGGYAIYKSLAAPNPNLPGDLNNDNSVNITDLSILLSNYNTSNVAADINNDGTVNILDLSVLLSHYGQSVTTGTMRDVFTGQSILNAINASSAGDTVFVHAGNYPKLTLNQTFNGTVNVVGEAGTVIAGVVFQNAAGLKFSNLTSSVSNTTDSGFYVSGTSHDITLANVTVRGGWDGIKVYALAPSSASNITVRDSDIAGASEDDFHIDGVHNMLIEHNFIHDPIDNTDHNDGIQSQRHDGLTITRNTISFASVAPQVGGPNNGIILSPVNTLGDICHNTVISNNLIVHWNAGRPLQLVGSNFTKIVNNTIVDDGQGMGEPSITLNDQFPTSGSEYDNLNVEIWNNIVNQVYITPGFAQPTFFDTNLITNPQSGMTGANAIIADPQFVNRVDYALSPASPAHGIGLVRSGTPTIDIDNATRPNPPGLGARL